ncbi:MAG: methyltransferase domain-containing protein [Hyphomicrobiales bacterium]|nr:methyltransferase domain-containing protein [Hyphomicrobiales bacterium]
MRRTPEEMAQTRRFDDLYARSQSGVMLSIERSVCGCDYGGSSWTTRAEADGLIASLGLNSQTHLLDLGAGSGWPALYMAKRSGCRVTLVDLPANGLRIAEQRAAKDGISAMVTTKIADAANLSFPDNSFDAISHSDLLCCLMHKRSVLASCRRIVRQTGRMAFTVISVAPGLSTTLRRRAIENGPEFIESADDYTSMLDQTGWKILAYQDISASYAASCNRQLEADEAHEEDLATLIGSKEYSERVAGWRAKLAAIGDGLLRRELFLVAP